MRHDARSTAPKNPGYHLPGAAAPEGPAATPAKCSTAAASASLDRRDEAAGTFASLVSAVARARRMIKRGKEDEIGKLLVCRADQTPLSRQPPGAENPGLDSGGWIAECGVHGLGCFSKCRSLRSIAGRPVQSALQRCRTAPVPEKLRT